MITNPSCGWCEFHMGDFTGNPSYLTDVPIELLEAFLNYKLTGRAMVWFDEEGSEFTLVMNPYSIFIIEEKEEPVLHDIDRPAGELLSSINIDNSKANEETTEVLKELLNVYGVTLK